MAPKGRANRGGGGPKKTTLIPSSSTTDDSFIVFSNSKNDPKSNTKGKAPAGTLQADQPEAPKKPDTRSIIGGASWTGKLPVNLLSEHCQKQKWDKPEYTMNKSPEGYSSMVILKKTDQKTKSTTVIPPFKLPPNHKHLAIQPTALEARHFAATYALFRICSMKNIHLMLPPTYRDLWKGDFNSLKEIDLKEDRAWMYEADPFAAKVEHDESQVLKAKKREEHMKARELKKDKIDLKMPTPGGNRLDRDWARVPKVDMGRRTRVEAESLAKSRADWNVFRVQMPATEQTSILRDLVHAGFRRSHVEEAVLECKDRQEVLEWLLIHVPEDDLPQWTLPEGYSAGVTLASNDLVKESKMRRLAEGGYSIDDCERALDESSGDEQFAAELLQNALLLHGGIPNLASTSTKNRINVDADSWFEEQSTLEAIYGDRYTSLSRTACQIKADSTHGLEPIFFRFIQPRHSYPMVVPILMIISKGLPAYIRLSVVRQAFEFAHESLLNDPMVFNLVDWLEANISRIIESPGKLRDISMLNAESPVSNGLSNSSGFATARKAQESNHLQLRPGINSSIALRESFKQRQSTLAFHTMLESRAMLPAWSLKDILTNTVRIHPVTIVSGETGSGKSTQAVQFVLDDLLSRDLGSTANIICTQPRRISALGLADRVSEERCVNVGEEIGYSIRGESKVKSGITKITFMTTGVLLRRLQTANDPSSALAEVSHIFVDEVHERSIDTDFLLAILKDTLKVRKDLRVVLMSATLDSSIFADYFGGGSQVGRIEVEGRTYPIRDRYLDDVIRETGFNPNANPKGRSARDEDNNGEDSQDGNLPIGRAVLSLGMRINYDLITSTVAHIHNQLGDEPGAILIFLPGTPEIDRCLTALRSIRNIYPLPLHASLPPIEQREVFKSAPRSLRKVIAATNVAETSITIADVVAVIDTGRVKETSYDPADNMVKLQEVWASRAACKQRRGRAGRVSAGTCYKLFTRAAEAKMTERPEPEIRRVPLEQLCLSVKAMGVEDVDAFLANTLTPPEGLAVSGALQLLERMGALQDHHLTALGRHLSMIPADLRCSKLLVYGAIFGCLESCLTIAAILTVKSPFYSPLDKRGEAKEARTFFSKGDGDLLTDLEAFNQWFGKRQTSSYWQLRSWCNEHFVSQKLLQDISDNRNQYMSSLKDIGFLPHSYGGASDMSLNRYGSSAPLLRALIAGAFSPQIAQISFPEKKFAAAMSGAVELDPEAHTIKYFNQDNGRVFVHPGSVLFDAQNFTGNAAFLSYFAKMATSKVFIRDLTPFNAYSLLLFSGPITLDTLGRGLVVDGWLRLRGWARIGVLVSRLRTLLDGVLAQKIEQPTMDVSNSDVVGMVRKMIQLNGLDE